MKSYLLHIVIIIVFVVLFVFTNYTHNEQLYDTFLFGGLIEWLVGGNSDTITTNNKEDIHFVFQCFLLTITLSLADYIRALIKPEVYWKRMFIAWVPVLVIYVINFIIVYLINSDDVENLFINRYAEETEPFDNMSNLYFGMTIISLFLIISGIRFTKDTAVRKFFDRIFKRLLFS